LGFGNVQVGSRATRTLTITNSGNAALTVSSLTGPSGFSASWTSGSIAAGQSQIVTIAFSPTTAGNFSGNLTVNGDQTAGSNSIGISGTGVLLRANMQLASSTGTYVCLTGLCTQFTYPITDTGPGCASNVQVTTRFFGSDGNGPQLGIDVPMGLAGGGALSSMLFRPGTTATVQNQVFFNDIRSAHTVFKAFITWTDVACP